MPTVLLLKYLPAHIFANLIYVFYYTLRGRGKVLGKAKWDAIRGLPNAIRKRKEILKKQNLPNIDLLASIERGWLQPYFLGFRLRIALEKSLKAE